MKILDELTIKLDTNKDTEIKKYGKIWREICHENKHNIIKFKMNFMDLVDRSINYNMSLDNDLKTYIEYELVEIYEKNSMHFNLLYDTLKELVNE